MRYAWFLLVIAASATACTSSGGPERVVTKYVDPSVSPSRVPSVSATSSTSSSAVPVLLRKLPGTCSDLLPAGAVAAAAGIALKGRTEFVVGAADPSIGRTAYLNCRYGLAAGSDTPQVEIGVSLYRSAAAAARRIDDTASDYESHGAEIADTEFAGVPGQVLTGSTDAGYTGTTAVAASGNRTVAVTVSDSVAGARTVAEKVTSLALTRTAH
jgi:hypothetical protein